MTTEREKLLDKIRALMSKTVENGCTQEEALAALAKAQAMMDAYEVSDEELRLTKEEKAVFRREPKGTKDPHDIKRQLAMSVAKFASCKVWRAREGGLVFCGMRQDAQFATWLLDHLATFVMGELTNHLMTDLSADRHSRNAVIRGFVWGCTARISKRLDELNTNSHPATENSRALVIVKGRAIADRLAEAGIQLGGGRRRSFNGDVGAYHAGKAAGDRASFGRPVSGNQGALRIGKAALAALAICIGLALHAPAQAADDATNGPVWIATDTLTCGKYKGVTWAGTNGAETFTRFYDVPKRDQKNIVLKDDGYYYKGKKCG